MKIGLPKECKIMEGRVALTPAAVASLVAAGHELIVQQNAGVLAGYSDHAYGQAGASLEADASEVYAQAELVVKVKEPQSHEISWLRSDHVLFCFLHLAAEPALLAGLLQQKTTAIAFETVMLSGGALPLLAPMSRIAGALAIPLGAQYLTSVAGGRGVLLSALPGLPRAHVVVLGGGVAGGQAAMLAAAMGARVTVFDRKPEVWDYLSRQHPAITTLSIEGGAVDAALTDADLLIGAVLLPGAKAPSLISRQQVAAMQQGSVIVDISVDQGGCIATTRPTTHVQPAYVEEGVIHLAVTNLPGIVPRTSTDALSAVLLPYVHRLSQTDWRHDPILCAAINVEAGRTVLPALQGTM